MRSKQLVFLFAVAIGTGLWGVSPAVSQRPAKKVTQPATLLTGAIRSASGQPLEGITVSARAKGSTITTSVFTQADGVYVFPPLDKGEYEVWAQAVGFNTARAQANLDAGAGKRQDFVMQPANEATTTRQMTAADWAASLPADTKDERKIKDVFYSNCAGCHQPNYPLQNRFDKAGWNAIIDLMKMVNVLGVLKDAAYPIIQYHQQALASYLEKARGPQSHLNLNIVSRPKGEATMVVVTEYALPLAENPDEYPAQDGSDWSEGVPSVLNGVRGTHDIEIDFNGNMWVMDSQENPRTYAKVDAKTGQVTSYKIVDSKGKPRTSHGVRKDANGTLWLCLSGSIEPIGPDKDSLAKLDPNTGKLDIYTPPDGVSGLSNGAVEIDGKGKIWSSTRTGAVRFDPATGEFLEFKTPDFKKAAAGNAIGGSSTYGVAADAEGNGYWAEMAVDLVGKSDIATRKSLEIKMPPRAEKMEYVTAEERKLYEQSGSDWNSSVPWAQGPRRLSGDTKGTAVWVANYWGDNLAKIDMRTNRVTQYPSPSKWSGIYNPIVDNKHVVWINMMNNDSVARFDPATEKWVEYMLPTHGAETRHIAIDNRHYPPDVVVPYSRTNKVARLHFRSKQDLAVLRRQAQTQDVEAQNR
jgi:streptogramin lyase